MNAVKANLSFCKNIIKHILLKINLQVVNCPQDIRTYCTFHCMDRVGQIISDLKKSWALDIHFRSATSKRLVVVVIISGNRYTGISFLWRLETWYLAEVMWHWNILILMYSVRHNVAFTATHSLVHLLLVQEQSSAATLVRHPHF